MQARASRRSGRSRSAEGTGRSSATALAAQIRSKECQAMKKRAVYLVFLGAMLVSVAASGQIYVPIPPTTGENRLQVLLTNLGAKPTFFRSRIYSPGRAPQAQGRFDLQPGQTVT